MPDETDGEGDDEEFIVAFRDDEDEDDEDDDGDDADESAVYSGDTESEVTDG